MGVSTSRNPRCSNWRRSEETIFARVNKYLRTSGWRSNPVALPVASFYVFQSVHFSGHRVKRLRQEIQALDMYAKFARLGAKEISIHAYDVAYVPAIDTERNLSRPLASWRT